MPRAEGGTVRKARPAKEDEETKIKRAKVNEATITVEEHLNNHAEELIQSLDEYVNKLCASLKRQAKKSKDEILSVYERKNGQIPAEKMDVVLTVESGPHQGEEFRLEPFAGVCYIGRSTGKRYRERGASLCNDPEASTLHAKIRVTRGKIVFTDAGSTNGSTVNGAPVDEGDAITIEHDMVLGIGGCSLRVALVKGEA
mmetsp:Transcript_17361/g.66129  ORF Transcript_17361/g.66129 Transcript_17361/m.66129 type:complete len:199 (-) Transcript_17361:48-644(-)